MPASIPNVYAPPGIGFAAPRAVYIHVPFCSHRCGYCDFTLVASRDDLIPAWFTAMQNELSMLDRRYDVDTIFVGGGTPTQLSPTDLLRFGQLIREHFQLAEDGEFSIEANPDGLDAEKLNALVEVGVNRVSLGVQSFDPAVLQVLERHHAPDEAAAAVVRTQGAIPNVSLDLIFGVPEQTLNSWFETLETAAGLPLTHLSTYGLTFEKGTDFFRRRSQGLLRGVDDELEREMYDVGIRFLQDRAFQQYEVSSFAQPGSRCRHNLVYWHAQEYFGFGPGAARYVNGIRSTNSRNVTRWITSWNQGQPALQDHETLDAEAVAREAIFLGLRMCDGIELSAFERRFGQSVESLASDAVATHQQIGNIEIVHGRLRLTDEGRFVADGVIADFL